ncbi:MAG TPA: ComEC/Rec2 family competence protein [Dongiaceae bacterium]|nr:ComEC/Rec2 family competence protein [Dongiaceae bacterium]
MTDEPRVAEAVVPAAGLARAAVGRVWRGLLANLLTERDRWALWSPVLLGTGVAAYFALPAEPAPWLGAAGCGLAVALLLACRHRPALVMAGLAGLLISGGFAAAQLRTALVAAPMLTRDLDRANVTGRIREVELLPKGQRIVLDQVTIAGVAAAATPARVRVTLNGDRTLLLPGQTVRLRAKLGPPSPPVALGAFDFQRAAYFQGIGATGFSYGSAQLAAAESQGDWRTAPLAWIAGLRQHIAQRILAVLPGPSGAIAVALVTGDQGAIPGPVIDDMRDSGLAHLLSISGLHIGLVAGILFVGLRAALAAVPRLALYQPIKKWAAAAALVGTLFYVLLAGAPVPAERAYVMTGIVLLAVIVDRSALSMRTVAWAAMIVLLLHPDALVGASFQMSFAAVVALIAIYETTERLRLRWRAQAGPILRRGYYLGGLAVTSLIATAATTPYAIYHFNRFAGYGVIANMIAVPLTGFWVMPWAVMALLLMPFGLERLALVPMGWGNDGIIAIAHIVADWPGAAVPVPAMPIAGLLLITFGGLWLCLWLRRWRLLGLPAIAAGFACIVLELPPNVLVSESGSLIAWRGPDGGLLLSSRRAGRFEAEKWLGRAGEDAETAAVWSPDDAAWDWLACDSLGCIYRAAGRVVAIDRAAEALAEDCAAADVVISLEPVRRPCAAGLVIDRFDLWREGAHALWIDADGALRVQSVNALRGNRPWVARPPEPGED